MAGPLLFGIVVERASYAAAWTAGGIALLLAAGLILVLQVLYVAKA